MKKMHFLKIIIPMAWNWYINFQVSTTQYGLIKAILNSLKWLKKNANAFSLVCLQYYTIPRESLHIW